jgi:cation transport ATPase
MRDGQTLEVPTGTILPGEVVLIRPGSRIPVDGQVVSGRSFVAEAAITGEPPAFGVMDKRARGFGCCSGCLSEMLYDVRLTYGTGLSLWSAPQTI